MTGHREFDMTRFASANAKFSQAVLDSEAPVIVLREPTDAELADFKHAFAVQFGASYLLEVAAAECDPTLTPGRARELATQALAEDGPQ